MEYGTQDAGRVQVSMEMCCYGDIETGGQGTLDAGMGIREYGGGDAGR